MNDKINLMQGDCLERMKTLADNSVDAIVSDPPYGISFMAKKWDYDVPSVEVWQEAMRVLKPGGHALIACGTRTQHRMVVNIEDAGFEIRDVVSWIYGSGFPKSLNISKSIDKAAGAEREVVGVRTFADGSKPRKTAKNMGVGDLVERSAEHGNITAPATDEAKQWDGWGTALKPSSEFFTLCRKPLSEKTIAANVLKWGTGGINIDGCRVGTEEITINRHEGQSNSLIESTKGKWTGKQEVVQGRFPANLIHDGSPEVLDLFPESKSGAMSAGVGRSKNVQENKNCYGKYGGDNTEKSIEASKGSAARFFYCAKASKKDRDEGLEGEPDIIGSTSSMTTRGERERGESRNTSTKKNNHPTVKPTALMQYLCRLITPTGGVVLDPYMGSGSTGKAAIREGFGFVGCELDPEYFEIAKTRIEHETTE